MPTATYPSELSSLDLYRVWLQAADLTDHFDPFRFEQRMAAYRLLIETTNHDQIFGPDNRRNPLWGLMFQHQWQFRTGRLGQQAQRDGRIDPDAAWGYGNYALCVLPWLGAVAAGTVPNLRLSGPPGATRFDYASGGGAAALHLPAEFRQGVQDWAAFFRLVAANTGADLEPIQFALWKAHKTCLDAVAPRIAKVSPQPYSELEHSFLRGWCRMVDYLWAAAWPTDFDFMTEHGLDVLPEQLLTVEVRGTLPEQVRRNVGTVLVLADIPNWRYRINLTLWQRVMRTRKARDEVIPLLDAVFNPTPRNTKTRLHLLRYLL